MKNDNKSGFSNFLLVIIILIIIFLTIFGFIFFRLRSAYVDVLSARQDLSHALNYINHGDFSKASISAQKASQSFNDASETIKKLQNNLIIKNLKIFNNNLNDFRDLSQTAEILSVSAEKSLVIINEVDALLSGQTSKNFLDLNEGDKIRILKLLYESYPEMHGIKANIDLSLIYLDKIGKNKLLSPYSLQIDNLKRQLSSISLSLNSLISISSIIPVLTGYPESVSYLILLQNSNELRPTGGFIGSYGILEVRLGEIVKLETHDSYHVDMPASLNKSFNVAPPEELKKYLGANQWFMRDANWSPDWPTSAKKIQWFYNEELKASNRLNDVTNFSGVIAITPRLITDLLYLVGPIEIDGKVYNKDNFIETLQYEVEMAFREDGISEWDRKSVIGGILQELKDRLYNLPSNNWSDLVNVFKQNIDRKNLMVYLNDDYSRQVSSGLNWGGEIKESNLDYLMVVDANLAAFKTDRVMDKQINYYLIEEADGRFRARVDIVYKNNGWFDWQTTRYRTFTRVYAPFGSTLINSSGLTTLPAVSSIDKEILYPKTYFGGFISIEPGQQGILTFEYYLPDEVVKKIKQNSFYSLILQKQPGNNISQFKAEITFSSSQKIQQAKAEGDLKIENNKIYWTNKLEKDQLLELSF